MKSKQRNQLRPHFFKKARHWRAFYLWGEEYPLLPNGLCVLFSWYLKDLSHSGWNRRVLSAFFSNQFVAGLFCGVPVWPQDRSVKGSLNEYKMFIQLFFAELE